MLDIATVLREALHKVHTKFNPNHTLLLPIGYICTVAINNTSGFKLEPVILAILLKLSRIKHASCAHDAFKVMLDVSLFAGFAV
jgi:hypothetical protein